MCPWNCLLYIVPIKSSCPVTPLLDILPWWWWWWYGSYYCHPEVRACVCLCVILAQSKEFMLGLRTYLYCIMFQWCGEDGKWFGGLVVCFCFVFPLGCAVWQTFAHTSYFWIGRHRRTMSNVCTVKLNVWLVNKRYAKCCAWQCFEHACRSSVSVLGIL